MTFIILLDPSLVIILHTWFILSVPVIREDDFKKNAFSLYDLYDHILAQEPLPLGS